MKRGDRVWALCFDPPQAIDVMCEIERHELRDDAGNLLGVEMRRGQAVLSSWSAGFDRALARHPKVLAAVNAGLGGR